MRFYQQLYVLLTLPLIFGCKYENGRYICETLIEIALEGKNTWRSLVFNINRPVNLPSDTFKSTADLEDLTIYAANTDNSGIESGAFDGLLQLQQLNIYNLYIPELSLGIQNDLPVKNLTLVGVTEKISSGIFNNLPQLTRVNINQNNIKIIEAGVFNDTPISHLFLENNKIERIEKFAFFNMPNLVKLSLSGNKLQYFESAPLGLSNSLRELWLDHNKIDYLDKRSFVSLENLQFLSLSFNKMHGIDYSALAKNRLGFLDLSNNELTEFIFIAFQGQAKWLDTLLLHNNKLNHFFFPPGFNPQNLRRISLGGNPFQCPCLKEIGEWINKRGIERVCDEEYTSGNRPSCVYTELEGWDRQQCVNISNNQFYTEQFRTEILKKYEENLQVYPETEECDVAKGYYS